MTLEYIQANTIDLYNNQDRFDLYQKEIRVTGVYSDWWKCILHKNN